MVELGLSSQGCNPESVVFLPLCESSSLTQVWLVPGVSQDIIMRIPMKIKIELLKILHKAIRDQITKRTLVSTEMYSIWPLSHSSLRVWGASLLTLSSCSVWC